VPEFPGQQRCFLLGGVGRIRAAAPGDRLDVSVHGLNLTFFMLGQCQLRERSVAPAT
jgi:hypothetical protein